MNISQTATSLRRLERNFDQLLEQQRFGEAERLLADSTEETPPSERPAPFSAPLRLKGHPGLSLPEGKLALPLVNGMSRRLRNARYRSQIEGGYRGLRVLELGDSWTQYSIVLQDVADWIAKDFAICSLGAADDTVEGIALDGEYVRAIRDEQPHAFLLSAGGNDLLGEGRLPAVLVDHTHGARPQDLVNAAAFDQIITRVVRNLREIVGKALHAKPDLKILIHGYDYARPVAGGPWLGRTLAARHIAMDLGRDVIGVIVDRFNAEIAQIAADFQGAVRHVDVRRRVGSHANSWHDELHPENAGFRRVAGPFVAELRRIAALAGVESAAWPEPTDPKAAAATDVSNGTLYSFVRKRADKQNADGLRNLRKRARRDPQVGRARKDFERLMSVLDDPEAPERIEARLEYSICSHLQPSERVVNRSRPDEFFVLSRGVVAGRAVARLLVRRPGGSTFGTGFLVGPNLLLTNHGVMPERTLATNAIASFDYELDAEGNVRAPANFATAATVFLTSERLDYTLVAVEPVSRDGRSLANFGCIALLPRSGKALKNELVNLIHHPHGHRKKVAIRENLVIGRTRDFLYYVSDSQPASPGAPVMNDEWQAAALHQMVIPGRKNPENFIAGRGVRISSILDDVSSRCHAGEADAIVVDRRLREGLSFANTNSDAEVLIRRRQPSPAAYAVRAWHPSVRHITAGGDPGDDFASCEPIDRFGEIDGADSILRLSDARRPYLTLGDVHWPNSHRNASDTWHLPGDIADREFAMTPKLIEQLIDAGRFRPAIDRHGKLIISLRGCRFADGSDFKEDETSIDLRPVSPNHEDLRCLIGVFDTAERTISLYRGSTVPRRTAMLGYYAYMNFNADRRMCNLLPTGCYRYFVGTGYSNGGPVTYVLRLGSRPGRTDSGSATVLRTSNDLSYNTRDDWDRTSPGDDIRPAFYDETFSSSGCLTVRGSQERGGSHASATGEWRRFRTKAGFDGRDDGRRYDNLLVTGHEAAAVASGGSDRPVCLRHGSKGDLVRSLQERLGVKTDGNFGAVTTKALTKLQQQKLGFATGTWTREMAGLLGMPFGP